MDDFCMQDCSTEGVGVWLKVSKHPELLTLSWQCKTEEELVAALQEAKDHPDSCARPACPLVISSPCHCHAGLLLTWATALVQERTSQCISASPCTKEPCCQTNYQCG